jgi:quinohemoprotein ethanol dehydrogenase
MRRTALFGILLPLTLAACAQRGAPDVAASTGSGAASVTAARLAQADREPGQWMAIGRTPDEQNFSPLDQINAGTIGRLGLAWYQDLDTKRGVESAPIVVDGVLYNTSPWNITYAHDAKTGALLWRYDPEVPRETARFACCDVVTRGLAVWEGKVVIATLDGRLIALDAATGEPVWNVQTLEQNWPYTITGAPRVFDGKVVIGNSGAELGVRGYVSAYDVDDGAFLWRFYTVPGNPADGFENEAMEMAAATWTGEWWKVGGGGTAWDGMGYDPALGLVYIGVGNGGPFPQAHRSPGGGDNLFLSSIVALDAETGEYRWHYQEVPGDQWDMTATQPIMLADLEIDGRMRHVLMQAPKNGFFYVLDRTNGELISAEKFAPVTWAERIDLETGRPVFNPAAFYGADPVLISPHPAGAHNFSAMSYSPETGLVYFPVLDAAMYYAAAAEFTPINDGRTNVGLGGTSPDMTAPKTWLTAWDPVAQREVWRVERNRYGSGGALATAGGLVFQGTIDQTLAAYDAETGAKVWESGPLQSVPIAAPISYMVDGEQYVAINVGWGGGYAKFENLFGRGMNVAPGRLLVFKLDGKAELPPLPDKPPPSPPPQVTASEEVIAEGQTLFARHCALCHGEDAMGGLVDLRMMTPEVHATFREIVLGGARADNGMASFADRIGERESDAIHQYLIARANEDWEYVSVGE